MARRDIRMNFEHCSGGFGGSVSGRQMSMIRQTRWRPEPDKGMAAFRERQAFLLFQRVSDFGCHIS